MENITLPKLERYELKFAIPENLIEPISAFVSVYCSLDKYSQETDDYFYGVNNLYLDTPRFLFLRNRLIGSENRFNMRIRSYGANPQFPYFLEIKQKKVNIIHKYRGRVYEEDWHDIITMANFIPKKIKNIEELFNIQLFQMLALTYNIEPKVFTQYRRKAYESNCEEYARVTFDIGLRYMTENRYNLSPIEDRMVPYDHPLNFDPGCNVILELKCYSTHVPLWMVDLIRTFDLRRRSFSKYVLGAIEALNLYRYADSSAEPVFF